MNTIFLSTFHNWKKRSAKEMNSLKIAWCKGHRRKAKIYDRRTLQSILWWAMHTYSRRVGVCKDCLPETRVRDWRLYPSTCLGEQVQGEHLPFAHGSVQGHPSSALHCWHWWRCGLHRSGCYLHQSHCGPLSGLSFEDCFILPNLFFSEWVYGLAVKGSLLEEGKWAHSWALQSWLGSWRPVLQNYKMHIFWGHKNFPKYKFCISKVAALGVLAGVGLVMPCFLFVLTCLFTCFGSIWFVQLHPAMLIFCCLWGLCEYNFYLLESLRVKWILGNFGF